MKYTSQAQNTFRLTLLAQLARNELDGKEIRQFIKSSSMHIPDLFEEYQANIILDAIELDELDWNAGYFDRQCRQAQHNFSEKRISHLINVREHLIQNGIAGFTKAPRTTESKETKEMENDQNIAVYVPGENLAEMVLNRSTSLARSALINELKDNRLEDEDITYAVAWAQERVPDLFVDYEEHSLAGKLINDPAQWDADYYYLQTTYVNRNFAKARFDHLISVRNVLRKRGVKGFERIVISKSKPQPQQQTQASSRPYVDTKSSQPEFLRVALMAGGALAVLAALVISLL